MYWIFTQKYKYPIHIQMCLNTTMLIAKSVKGQKQGSYAQSLPFAMQGF